jgi:RIO-like serine/threonine protein kinase
MSLERFDNSENNIVSNEPRMLDGIWAEYNGECKKVAEHIKNFIANDERFKNEEVSIEFTSTGVSSLVSIITSPDQKLVLKVPILTTRLRNEPEFLKAWESAGVSVPQVIEQGQLHDRQYMLMDFIDAQPLGSVKTDQEMIDEKIYMAMGSVLRKMHTPIPPDKGFGKIKDGLPAFKSFTNWIRSEDLSEKYTRVQQTGVLSAYPQASIEEAIDILENYTQDQPETVYTHNDFSIYNIFDTKPLTVFDPAPGYNINYIDLGKTIANAVAKNNIQADIEEQILEGYYENTDQRVNREILDAAIIFQGHIKLDNWIRNEKIESIKNFQNYVGRMIK